MMSRIWWQAGFLVAVGLAGCRAGDRDGTLTAPQVADVQVALGRTLEGRGETEAARGHYAEAAKNDPKRADAWARQAVLADKEGRFDESWGHHQKALALDPANPDLLCNFGYSLYLQERWAEAEDMLRRAVTLKADHQRAQNNLGLVLARTGRPDDALECFARAGCPRADAHTNLAYALTLSGDFAGAKSQYDLALRVQPGLETARKGLERLDVLVASVGRQASPTGGAGAVQASATIPAPPAASPR